MPFLHLCRNPFNASCAFYQEQDNMINPTVATSNSHQNYPGSRVRCCILILSEYLINSLLMSLQLNSDGFSNCPQLQMKFSRLLSMPKICWWLVVCLFYFFNFALNLNTFFVVVFYKNGRTNSYENPNILNLFFFAIRCTSK